MNLFTDNILIDKLKKFYTYRGNLYATYNTIELLKVLYKKQPENKVLHSLYRLADKSVSVYPETGLLKLSDEVNAISIKLNLKTNTFNCEYIEFKTIQNKISFLIKQLEKAKVNNADIFKILNSAYRNGTIDFLEDSKEGYDYKANGFFNSIKYLKNGFYHTIKAKLNEDIAETFTSHLDEKTFFEEAKFGRMVGKIFKQVPAKDLEQAVDLIETELALLVAPNKKNNIIKVSGNSIAYYYNENNYTAIETCNKASALEAFTATDNNNVGGGELFKSCVRNQYNHTYFGLYTDNKQVSMLIHINDKGKIDGRSILWHIDKINYFDRIYATNNKVKLAMYAWLDLNNYTNISKSNTNYNSKKDISKDTITFKLDKTLFKTYSYLDTLCHIDIVNNTVSNKPVKTSICLTSQTQTMNQTGRPTNIAFTKDQFIHKQELKNNKELVTSLLNYLETNWTDNPSLYKEIRESNIYGKELIADTVQRTFNSLTQGMMMDDFDDGPIHYRNNGNVNTTSLTLFKFLLTLNTDSTVKGIIENKSKISKDSYFTGTKICDKKDLIKYLDTSGNLKFAEIKDATGLHKILTTSSTSFMYVTDDFVKVNKDILIYSNIYDSYILKKYHIKYNDAILLNSDFTKAKEIFSTDENSPLHFIKQRLYKEVPFKDLINAKVLKWDDVKKLNDRKNKTIKITLKDIISVEGVKYLYYQNIFIQILSKNEKKQEKIEH